MLPNLLFGSFLIVLSGVLLWMHICARLAAHREGANERDLNFSRRQYRRRLQVCTLLAVIGVAIIGGPFMTNPLFSAGYWGCVLLLAIWLLLLAIADLRGSRAHLQVLRDEHETEHAALRAELAKFLPHAESNGTLDSQER